MIKAIRSQVIRLKCDLPNVSASEHASYCFSTTRYEISKVRFIIAISTDLEMYETIHRRGWSVILLARRGLLFILFLFFSSFIPCGRKGTRAICISVDGSQERKMVDADYPRLSVIPWNRTCYCKLPRVYLHDRFGRAKLAPIAIWSCPSGPYAGLIRALITGYPIPSVCGDCH